MSRDRLRDLRAQQQGSSQPPLHSGPGYQDTNYYAPPPVEQQYNPGYGQPQGQGQYPPAPPPHQQYQMQNLPADPMQVFFAEVDSIQGQIRQLHSNINSVSELHTRRLQTTDDPQSNSTQQLAALSAETSALTNAIRTQIHRLNEKNRATPKDDNAGFNTRKGQIAALQNSFRKTLEEYNLVEKNSREKYRQRMERQIKIVKPDATEQEINEAFNDQSGGQVFSQALVQSRQSGARAAFQEVQSRNQDLRKIEETITQLAQMMQDMATLVLEQDDSVRQIETHAVQAKTDMEQGRVEVTKATNSARAARKKKWICFIIVVLICIVIAVVVAVEVTKK